jgi:hypothetical protein
MRSTMSEAKFVTRVSSFASTFRPNEMACMPATPNTPIAKIAIAINPSNKVNPDWLSNRLSMARQFRFTHRLPQGTISLSRWVSRAPNTAARSYSKA